MLQLDLGYNPISNLEVVSLINLHNLGRGTLFYYDINRTKKYNPKVYFGTLSSLAAAWNYNLENGRDTTISFWPERYQQKI